MGGRLGRGYNCRKPTYGLYIHTSFVDSSLVPYHIICVRTESGNLKFYSFTANPDLHLLYSKSIFTIIVQKIQIYSYCTTNPDLQLLYNKSRFTVFIQQIKFKGTVSVIWSVPCKVLIFWQLWKLVIIFSDRFNFKVSQHLGLLFYLTNSLILFRSPRHIDLKLQTACF